MTYKDRIFNTHLISLSSHYGDRLEKYNFESPVIYENQNDSVLSNSPSKKVAYITRHLLTSEVTHSIILDKESYSRV